MRCSCCDGLTIDRLLELHELHVGGGHEHFKHFPDTFYMHQPSFQSLVESARDGCDICQAIVDAVTADRACMAKVIQRIAQSLDTSVGIRVELNNYYSRTLQTSIFDRLLVKVGSDLSNQYKERTVRLSLTRPQCKPPKPSMNVRSHDNRCYSKFAPTGGTSRG
jgi:hypothetical protein